MDNNNMYNQTPEVNDGKGMSIAILILGITSITCTPICGVIALILYFTNKAKISLEHAGKAKAGFICGCIGVGLWVIGIVAYILLMGLGIVVGIADSY